jgi:hypothetical protein
MEITLQAHLRSLLPHDLPEFPSPTRGAFGRYGNSRHTRSSGVSGWALNNHAVDEFALLTISQLPTQRRFLACDFLPIEFETSTMPAHYRLRLNENQCLPPPKPERHEHSETLICTSSFWLLMLLLRMASFCRELFFPEAGRGESEKPGSIKRLGIVTDDAGASVTRKRDDPPPQII